jgi:hypothetical protein
MAVFNTSYAPNLVPINVACRNKDADKPLYKPKAPSCLKTIAPVLNIPGGLLDPALAAELAPPPEDVDVDAHSPCNCIRTFTKSIGCVTAPDAIAPRAPLANPFHAAGGAWCSRGFRAFSADMLLSLSLSLFVFLFPARSLLRAAMVDRLKVVIVLDWIS